MIQFHNAKDIDGHVVHINEVTKDNRAEHYYCLGCNCEMSPVLGNKREHHFRHKEAHCSWESYLHILGKKGLKERFETQQDFVVQYQIEYHCNKTENCRLGNIYHDVQNCNRRELISVDLKKEYDTCEEEVYYKGYKADLKLSSKEHPEREPLFLEIHVTNACSPDKLASGVKIIEIDIESEEDVLKPIIESPSIRFYNFKRFFETKRPLDRFWIAKDDKGILRAYCACDGLNCKDVNDNHRKDAIFELAMPSEVVNNRGEKPNIFQIGFAKAISEGIDVRHCRICNKYWACSIPINIENTEKKTGENVISKKWYRNDSISDKYMDKMAYAWNCEGYSYKRSFVFSELGKLKNMIYWEWKRG